MPPKNPYKNIKITLKEDESKFLLDLLQTTGGILGSNKIGINLHSRLFRLIQRRQLQIERHGFETKKESRIDTTSKIPRSNTKNIIRAIQSQADKLDIDLEQDKFLAHWREEWTAAYRSGDIKELIKAKDNFFKLAEENRSTKKTKTT